MGSVRAEKNPDRTDTSPPPVGVPACFGIGVAAGVLGLLPWLLTGLRLPLQNLWAVETLPADMPISLLPLSQYAITVVLSLVVTGSAFAGVSVRALRARLALRAVIGVGAGTLAVHLVAAVQSTTTVAFGLSPRTASQVYLAAVVILVVVAVLTGLLVFRLISSRSWAVAVVGLSVAALLLAPWVVAVLTPTGTVSGDWMIWATLAVQRWMPAILVGAAIAWGGLGTRRRVVAAVSALVLLWIVPAVATAVTSAASFRLLLPYPAELLVYGMQVLQAALLQPGVVVPPLLVALVVAGAGIAARRLPAQRREPQTARTREDA